MDDPVVPECKKQSFWRRRVTAPLLALLRQGTTPAKLSLALALGFVLGVFPILGTTTLLCVVVVAALRLNQAAAQVGNVVSTLFFIPLLIPFVRLGEFVTGASQFPLAMHQLREIAEQGVVIFFKTLSVAIVHGILGWAIAAPVITAMLYFAILPFMPKSRI